MIYEVDFTVFKNFKNVLNYVPELSKMGVTILELMPVLTHNAHTTWGYETTDFLSIHKEYGTAGELEELIIKCKKHKIKVVIDMCFNHCGDTSLFNDNWFVKSNGYHTNHSGCGNTFNAHNPEFKKYCQKSLEMLISLGVGGFRFDLAPLLMIMKDGTLKKKGSLLELIEFTYSNLILIYEPWSPEYYLKSKFPQSGYEWNDKLRDSIRNYIISGGSNISDLIFEMNAYQNNINYVSCHDGFTLFDCFSNDFKNNHINGEDNNDGNQNEVSKKISEDIIYSQCKKAIQLCILSKGIPMLRSGDEDLLSLGGNNNNYLGLASSSNHGSLSSIIKSSNSIKKSIDYSTPITYNDNHIIFAGKDCTVLIDR